jgi:hypothetical protein
VDEIKLFEELQPPPPPDAPRMREAARARLTAATSAPLTHPSHPARRRGIVVAVAAAAALVTAGTGYGITAVHGGSSPRPSGSSTPLSVAAGLTAVHGCPGKYITAGTLKRVSGTRLVIQPANDTDHVNRVWRAQPVTVTTSHSTVVSRPANGTVSDITDGSHVMVQGTWSGRSLAATEVSIEAALPPPGSFGPFIKPHQHVRRIGPPFSEYWLAPPFGMGTVVDAHDGSFTMVSDNPLGPEIRIPVITSHSTKVVTRTAVSLSQLELGANVVVVGQIGPHGVLAASTVAVNPSSQQTILAGGPVKIRSSGCSASAITTAVMADG